jgi:CubicO group peptidase (beta-lactamase class C family)
MKHLLMSMLLTLSFTTVATSAQDAMNTIPAEPAAQVTFMNWSEQPYNHWSFRNIGVQSSVMVPRAGNITLLPEALDSSVADIKFKYQGNYHTVDSAMIADNTDGYIVIKGGKIVYEEYFGEFGEHDHHLWASSTKSLVGLCMGILVEQGKVKIDENVGTYLPELKGTHFGQRSVREVLNMVSALDYTEDYENFTPGAVSTEYFRRLGFVPAFDLMAIDPTQDDTPRGILEFIPRFEQNPKLAPSQVFEYHSPNVDVAGWIIARVSGKPLNKFVADNVWTKLNVEHDAFFMADVAFNPIATGGFNTTLRDFARVGMVLLNNGKYEDEQIFPEAWVDETFSLTNSERRHMERSAYKNPDGPVYDEWLEGYKNYLWVHDTEKGIATFRGVFGQHLYINKDKDIVIATFSSAASASNAARASNKPRMAAFEAISEALK